MSLINEALKRAQHQRKVDEAGFAPPVPGGSGHRIIHRGKPMASQTLLLIVAGSAVLVVLTVIATVYLLRDDSKPAVDRPILTAPVTPAVDQAATDVTPTVVLAIPTPVAPPATHLTPAPAGPATVTAPVVDKTTPPERMPAGPADTPVQPSPVTTAVIPATTGPTPVKPAVAKPAPSVATAPLVPDQQVLIFLDNLKILGVRFSGIDSKVLIGDRVFRVNDVIERNFGLRLVEVQPDRLFFVDAKGIAYTKNL